MAQHSLTTDKGNKMTKSERKEAEKLMAYAKAACSLQGCNYAARGMSALIRATATKSNRNELITLASDIPAVVQSAEFIV